MPEEGEEEVVVEEEEALVQVTRALLRKGCLSLHDFFASLAEGVCEEWCEDAGQRVLSGSEFEEVAA